MQARSIMLTIAAAGLLNAAVARAEDFNEFESLTISVATSFTIVLQGDVVSSINTIAMETDPTVNPFYWAITNQPHGHGTSTVTAALNGQGNTVVTFTGPYPLMNGQTNIAGHMPHFGLDSTAANGSGARLTVVSQYWSDNASKTQLPSVTVKAPPLGTGPVKYEIFFVDLTEGAQTVGEWFEVPFTGNAAPVLAPTASTNLGVTLSNAGFMTSPTLIPLDNLNFGGDFAPTGSPGSQFAPEAQYDVYMSGVPEPSTWAMMVLGLAGLGFVEYRRSRRECSRALAAA